MSQMSSNRKPALEWRSSGSTVRRNNNSRAVVPFKGSGQERSLHPDDSASQIESQVSSRVGSRVGSQFGDRLILQPTSRALNQPPNPCRSALDEYVRSSSGSQCGGRASSVVSSSQVSSSSSRSGGEMQIVRRPKPLKGGSLLKEMFHKKAPDAGVASGALVRQNFHHEVTVTSHHSSSSSTIYRSSDAETTASRSSCRSHGSSPGSKLGDKALVFYDRGANQRDDHRSAASRGSSRKMVRDRDEVSSELSTRSRMSAADQQKVLYPETYTAKHSNAMREVEDDSRSSISRRTAGEQSQIECHEGLAREMYEMELRTQRGGYEESHVSKAYSTTLRRHFERDETQMALKESVEQQRLEAERQARHEEAETRRRAQERVREWDQRSREAYSLSSQTRSQSQALVPRSAQPLDPRDDMSRSGPRGAGFGKGFAFAGDFAAGDEINVSSQTEIEAEGNKTVIRDNTDIQIKFGDGPRGGGYYPHHGPRKSW